METKNNKNSPIVFYILGFIIAVFFELYWIGNFPYDYFMLIGIGLIVLIMGYLTFDGIIKAYNEASDIRNEQNEIMIKAQKAIYLAAKKNSAEAEKMQIQSLKAVNLLMDRMVNTITEKQIEAKSSEPADMSGLIAELTASNARLAKEVQNAVTVNQLVKANEELVRSVQDVLKGKPEAADAIASPVNQDLPQSDDNNSPIVEQEYFNIPVLADAFPENIPDDNGDNNDSILNIDDITLEELDEMNTMDTDIARAEAAVADVSQTIEAIEAADEMDASIEQTSETVTDDLDSDNSVKEAADELESDPNAMLSQEEIAKLFTNL